MDAAKADGVETSATSRRIGGASSKSNDGVRQLSNSPDPKRSKIDGNDEAELSLPLQLSIAFLAAGDLGRLAAVNRAARKAAVASYLQRLRAPHNTAGPSSAQIPLQQAKGTQPYQLTWGNPWSCLGATSNNIWSAKCLNAEDYTCSNWDIEWKQHDDGILQAGRAKFHIPNDFLLPQKNRRHKVAHCSLVQDSLLVIAVKKYLPPEAVRQEEEDEEGEITIDMEYDEDEEHDEMKKDVWAVLYNVASSSSSPYVVVKDDEFIYHASLAELIKGPIPKSCYFDYEELKLGSTCRSGNGQMFCTVTQLPNDQEDEDEGAAQISVYEVMERNDTIQEIRLVQELSVEMVNLKYDYNNIDIGMSTDGTVLSILNQEKYRNTGGWTFYLRDSESNIYQELVEFTAQFSHSVMDAFFTVDQDFVMTTQIVQKDLEKWLGEKTIPKVLARRFLIYGEDQCPY